MRSRACVQRREDREQGVRAAEAARPGDDAATVGYPAEDGTVVNLPEDRKSTRLNSSHANISYAVFCLKKKKNATRGLGSPHYGDREVHQRLLTDLFIHSTARSAANSASAQHCAGTMYPSVRSFARTNV